MNSVNSVNNVSSPLRLSFTLEQLLEEAHAESAYIAHSIFTMQAEKSSVLPLILNPDHRDFARRVLDEAFAAVVTALQAYVLDGTSRTESLYEVVLQLPAQPKASVDALLMHEMERAFVTFLLSRWYECKLPQIAARQYQLFEAAIATIKHDIYMAYGGMKRPHSYI